MADYSLVSQPDHASTCLNPTRVGAYLSARLSRLSARTSRHSTAADPHAKAYRERTRNGEHPLCCAAVVMPEMFRKARHHGLYLVVEGESTDRCAASVVPCCSVQIPAHPRAIRRLFVLSSGSPVVKHGRQLVNSRREMSGVRELLTLPLPLSNRHNVTTSIRPGFNSRFSTCHILSLIFTMKRKKKPADIEVVTR